MGFLKKLSKKLVKSPLKKITSSAKGHGRFLKSIGKTVQGMLNPGAAYADALSAAQSAQPQETQIDEQALAENSRRRKRSMQTGGRQSTILTGSGSGSFGG